METRGPKHQLTNKTYTTGQYKIRIIEPDTGVNYSIVQIRPDDAKKFKIVIIDPFKNDSIWVDKDLKSKLNELLDKNEQKEN